MRSSATCTGVRPAIAGGAAVAATGMSGRTLAQRGRVESPAAGLEDARCVARQMLRPQTGAMRSDDVADPAVMPERLLTAPLVVFLLMVSAIVAGSWSARLVPGDFPTTLRELADGDLDGAERRVALLRLRELAAGAAGPTAPWAAWLAAIALGEPGLGSMPPPTGPAADDVRWLHLGDALLRAVADAGLAELAGDRGAAVAHWRQVAAQARLGRQAVAGDLAAAALQRLGG